MFITTKSAKAPSFTKVERVTGVRLFNESPVEYFHKQSKQYSPLIKKSAFSDAIEDKKNPQKKK